jgi:hypothetical protein
MDFRESPYVGNLKDMENEFLQVILRHFTLERSGEGAVLNVRFDNDTPSITRRAAKADVKSRIPDFDNRARDLQRQLDDFLLRAKGETLAIDTFPFRFVSGGSLPVLRFLSGGTKEDERSAKSYYCLFFRDVDPIGWNIANGGSDSRTELLDPPVVIERELREELIIVNLRKRIRYVFGDDLNKPLNLPEFEAARKVWKRHFPQLDFPAFDEVTIPLRWGKGPDVLHTEMHSGTFHESHAVEDCYLNINALDFGIEIDRVAHIDLDRDAIICDGELSGGDLLNQVVGLFDVEGMNERVLDGDSTGFEPDRIFFSGVERNPKDIDKVVEEYLLHARTCHWQPADRALWESTPRERRYDVCPVTRRIIARHARIPRPQQKSVPEAKDCSVFVSFTKEDQDLAQRVYDFVTQRTDERVFFSNQSNNPEFFDAINSALCSAKWFIPVASAPEHLYRRWLKYEADSFILQKLALNKDDSVVIPFIRGFKASKLPNSLLRYRAVEFEPNGVDSALDELLRLMQHSRSSGTCGL